MSFKDAIALASQAGFQIKSFASGAEIGVDGGVVFLTLTKEVDRLIAIARATALREVLSLLDGDSAAARVLVRMAGEYEDQARRAG